MRILLFLLMCAAASGQGLEIRGVVQEYGSNSPVAGAEVTVKEFVLVDGLVTPKVVATILTNARGEYVYRPEHEANFYVETRKDGYEDATGRTLTPSAEQPASVTREQPMAAVPALLLMRPGEVFGRLVDGDGAAHPNLSLSLRVPSSPFPVRLTTDVTGAFRATNLQPGKYLIRIAPTGSGLPEVVPFSETEFEKVDEGVETGYWPGGVADPARALPIEVASGARVNVGTLVIRKVKYPRIHVSVEGDCSGATWSFIFSSGYWVNDGPAFSPGPCRPELLLKFVPPAGAAMYMADLKSKRWGSAEIVASDRRVTTVVLHDAASVPVRIVPPEGTPLSSVGKVQISFAPADRSLLFGNQFTLEPNASGAGVIPEVPWAAHRVSVTPLAGDLYVKAIRYSGNPLNGPVFEHVAGGTLEIELDNRAPTVRGTVERDRGSPFVLLVRWPMVNEVWTGANPPFQFMQRADAEGKFNLRVAPGEYRVVAMTEQRMTSISSAELRELLVTGERVVVERGEEKTLDLKVTAR